MLNFFDLLKKESVSVVVLAKCLGIEEHKLTAKLRQYPNILKEIECVLNILNTSLQEEISDTAKISIDKSITGNIVGRHIFVVNNCTEIDSEKDKLIAQQRSIINQQEKIIDILTKQNDG